MKFKNIAFPSLMMMGLALTSCSEGKYWDEPSSLPDSALGFAKPKDAVVIPADGKFPTSYDIQIARSDDHSDLTVPVVQGSVLSLSSSQLAQLQPDEYKVVREANGVKDTVIVKAPAIVYTQKSPEITTSVTEVKFQKGQFTAPLKIDIDTTAVEPGYEYNLQLTVCEPRNIDMSVASSSKSLDFKISQTVILNWEPAGTALVSSSSLLADAAPVTVNVEVASNYPDKRLSLYRLVSPYHYLDPENVKEGYNIEFLCNKGSKRRASAAVEGWQQTGVISEDANELETNVYLGSGDDLTSSFQNKDNSYKLTESIGFNRQGGAAVADPLLNESTQKPVTEVLSFTWNF